MLYSQKQSPRSAPRKGCSENMQENYRRKPMPKCDFNKVEKQLFWNHTLAWVFSCKFAAYFQNIYFFWEQLWCAASVISLRDTFLCFTLFTLHYFYVALFSCCTFFCVVIFSFCTFYVACCISLLHFFRVGFFPCCRYCTVFILNFFYVAPFSCIQLFQVSLFHVVMFSFCILLLLHT